MLLGKSGTQGAARAGAAVRGLFMILTPSLLMSLAWIQVQLLWVPCACDRRALPPLSMSLQTEFPQRVQVQGKIN